MMVSIVGARAGFRVVLNTKDRLAAMGHRSHRAVVEIEMRDLDGVFRQACRIQGETMVLAGDFHLTGGAARVVQTSMAVTQLEGGSPHGQTKDLMAEADAKPGKVLLLQQSLASSCHG